MIHYRCICGVGVVIGDNSEESRKMKRAFKKKHSKGKKNPGHGWIRVKVKKDFLS